VRGFGRLQRALRPARARRIETSFAMKQALLIQEPSGLTARELARRLGRYRFPVSVEKAMQDAVESALLAEKLEFRREVTRGADRIDFVVGSVGVELKVKGSAGEVQRQLERYALWEDLTELVLVTSKGAHRALPSVVGGKPLIVNVTRGVF
jgi:hypothetical protein